MVEFRRDPDAPGPVITGFSGRAFRVRDSVFPDGLILTPHNALSWHAPAPDALTIDDARMALELDPAPEFLLLGTGSSLVHPPRAFVRALEERGIGVEAMDSRAAARAWGVLRAEERWIVGLFLPL